MECFDVSNIAGIAVVEGVDVASTSTECKDALKA